MKKNPSCAPSPQNWSKAVKIEWPSLKHWTLLQSMLFFSPLPQLFLLALPLSLKQPFLVAQDMVLFSWAPPTFSLSHTFEHSIEWYLERSPVKESFGDPYFVDWLGEAPLVSYYITRTWHSADATVLKFRKKHISVSVQ